MNTKYTKTKAKNAKNKYFDCPSYPYQEDQHSEGASLSPFANDTGLCLGAHCEVRGLILKIMAILLISKVTKRHEDSQHSAKFEALIIVCSTMAVDTAGSMGGGGYKSAPPLPPLFSGPEENIFLCKTGTEKKHQKITSRKTGQASKLKTYFFM